MIETLRVSGLALLEDCELDFSSGLTVISGETGAGKTVLLTSLRLVMGGRAEGVLVAPDSKRTEIDCVAALPASQVEELEEAGFATEQNLVVFSRTVQKEGRSRAAISGRPVPAKLLSETLGRLITLHGQSDQWRLKDSTAQRDLLDAYAGEDHSQLLERTAKIWGEVSAAQDHLEQVTKHHGQLSAELAYLEEAVQEIEALKPRVGEEAELDQGIDRLTNVAELREEASIALNLISGGERSVVEQVGMAADQLRRGLAADPSLKSLSSRADGLELEAVELASDLRDYLDSLFDDPDELARLHDRRAQLTDVMRGKATDVDQLLQWHVDAQRRIGELEGDGLSPSHAQAQLEKLQARLEESARRLSDSRAAAAKRLSKRVNEELAALALKDAVFAVQLEPVPPGRFGADRVTMTLQTHPSAPPASLAQGASGGELSRVMLALEVALADESGGHTFVFDEVDAGVGGKTVGTLANRLAQLARSAQVIVVTHQPTIAAMAQTNFVVEKTRGKASVRRVCGDARTDEIVRMLGGDSGAARRLALELEQRARATIEK